MTAPYDDAEFIDRDFQASKAAAAEAAAMPSTTNVAKAAPPTRQELETQLGATQQQIEDLRRLQEQLERERSAIEETRRRRAEFETGRSEVIEHLTRGIGLLEKAELDSRRRAEQLARTLEGFRECLSVVQSIREENWTEENLQSELTTGLTAVENARMEWNAARVKWTLLGDGESADTDVPAPVNNPDWRDLGFWQLCRLGLAVTLPLAIVGLAAIGLLVTLLIRG